MKNIVKLVRWVGIGLAATPASGCGATAVESERGEAVQRDVSDSPIAALEACPTPTTASLETAEEAPDSMRATLFWNPESGSCALDSGRYVPESAEAILRFAKSGNEYAVLAVLPWMLRGPAPDSIEPDRSIGIKAALEDEEVEVEFVFDEDGVTIESVRVP